MRRPITLLRRISQVFCFSFIVFGAFFGLEKQNLSFLPLIEAPEEYGEYRQQLKQEGRAITIVGPDYPQAFDTYLPIKSCRFSRQTGTFRGCFMHFVSECIGWATPLRLVIPHILLFVILAVLLGRLWCGWVCPLGFIQDILNIVRKNIKLKPFFLSPKTKGILKGISYVLLISIIVLSIISAIPAFSWALRKQVYLSVCQMCPSRYIFPYLGGWPIVHNFVPLGYGIFTTVSIIFTLLFVASFFIKRTWCRICPSGLLLSFFNRGGLLNKKKDVLKCTRCGICVEVCPLQNREIYLEKKKENVDYASCIHCFQCVDACPEDGCLKVKFLGKVIFKSKFKG
jgi:polyferredoxin